MAVREIVTYPDEKLTTPCEAIETVDDEVRTLLDDLAETMYAAPGVGLAAPQVGVLKQALVIDASDHQERGSQLIQLVNPRIVERRGVTFFEEGCLSFPSVFEEIKRAEWVRISALNRDGEQIELEGDGLLGVALQHEIDHLRGVVFIEHMSRLKRSLVRRRMKKRKANG